MLVCSAKELMNEYEFVQSFIPNFNPRPQYVCGLLTPALSATRARKSICVCVCGVPKTYGDEAGERERQSLPTP